MGKAIKIYLISFSILFLLIDIGDLRSDTVEEIDKRAHDYYEKKEFNKAITEWLTILEIDPTNEEIQRKVESVYDEKHKKDISLQKAKIQLKIAKKFIGPDLDKSNSNADKAWENFVIAYRIDPKDSELQLMKEEMRKFKKELKIENRKKRLSQALKQKYLTILPIAREKMRLKQYEEALTYWNELLTIVPMDIVSNEGRRQAELAIENRLKFERIMALLESGVSQFNAQKFQEAELDFKQAIRIDSENRDALSYLEKIDEILSEKRNLELVKIQAEQLYNSGINNIKRKNFDGAEEDFENILSLIENYKDAPRRLRSIERLRKEHEEQQRVSRLKKIDRQFQSGLLSLSEGKYKDAIIALEAVLLLDPENSLAKKYIQTAKEAQELLEEETVDIDSPYYSIINSLIVTGKLFYEKGDYSDSRRNWEKILNLFPKNRIATEYLLKCSLKLNPKAFDEFARNLINEGRGLLKEKKYKQALWKFEMIKSMSKDYPDIDNLITRAKKGIGRKKMPIISSASSADIAKRSKTGIDYYRKGGAENIKLALQQFKWISSKDPENVSALIYINKIESQLRVGTRSAPKRAKKLTKKQKRLVRVHYFKGINFYFDNRFNKAISEWRKVLVIDPGHEKAKMNIRKCLVLLKR